MLHRHSAQLQPEALFMTLTYTGIGPTSALQIIGTQGLSTRSSQIDRTRICLLPVDKLTAPVCSLRKSLPDSHRYARYAVVKDAAAKSTDAQHAGEC